ncbi:unnamed protein product [Cuscuta campestris]|uniref:RNase H type-1 domain-containing protein n=1 Tax=Cuscuta campestris TaxID=132261 RepID=A0A484KG80_9ASTE|nr:unnamed protein product [Cuscuta campestris]
MSSSQQINATSAQVQATTEGATIPMVATLPAIFAPVMPLGLSSTPTPSVVTPFTIPVPSTGPRVTFPPSMTQFMNDPANLQAIQGFGQVMAMCQQSGGVPFLPGMFPFALPSARTMPLQTPMTVSPFQTPVPQPSLFQPQLVSAVAPVNLSVESGDDEWDIPRAHKKKNGKNIPPATSRNSTFERLGDREEGQRKSAKLRLGQSVAHVSAFARLGKGREAELARTQRSRSNQQKPARTRVYRQEEEAESQPRGPVANRLTVPNDRVQQMEAKLNRLEKRVGEKNDRDKSLARSPFTTRVHLIPFPRKAKFQENCIKRKKFTYLSTAGQRESENLTQFLTRWKKEVEKVEEMDDKTMLSLLLNGLRAGEVYKEFCRKPLSTYQEAYHTAWEFAEAETQLRAKRKGPGEEPPIGGDSAAQQNNWVRSIYVGEVSAEPARRKQTKREPIVFTNWDLPPTGEDHNDQLVITMDINGVDVTRVLVDTGSSVNILYLETFQKLSLCRTQLDPLKTPLSGSTRDTVEAEGSIVLPVELGSGDKTVWKKMRFIVVDIKCIHNAILGRPDINRVGEVISMPHLCMKFHTPGGVGEVKGDQKNARECYARAVRKMTKGVNVISQEIPKGETREKLEPEAETVEIKFHPGDSSRMVRIGANLPEDLKAEITQVLQEYAGIFAWGVADMPRIDRSIIFHRLTVREGSRLVCLKKRYLASDRRDFVKKEVKDLLSVDLPVNKPTEQWWEMAIDGASGFKGYGGGIVFTTPEGFKIYHAIIFNFKLTNNEAEYEALAGGLRLAQALKISRVSIKSDSSLIVWQVTGNMEAREGRMMQYKDLVLALLKGFKEFKIAQTPRAENADADLLSKLTQYAPEHVSKLARVEILDCASIEKLEVATIAIAGQSDRSNTVGEDDQWMGDLMKYLTDGSLPEQDDRARKVKLRAPRF